MNPGKIFTFILSVGGSLIVQHCCSPADCPKAKRGYQQCEPAIAALEKYFARNKKYPEKLADLNLPKNPAANFKEIPVSYAIAKNRRDYTIKFSYKGPGINQCVFTPKEKWRCLGYY